MTDMQGALGSVQMDRALQSSKSDAELPPSLRPRFGYGAAAHAQVP